MTPGDPERLALLALREAEAKYRDLFEGALEGMYRISLGGNPIAVNPELARMLGFASPEELAGTVTDTGQQVWVDASERARYVEILKRDGVIRAFEAAFRCKGGDVIWVALSSRLARGADGTPLYIQGFVVDITEHKKRSDECERLSKAIEQVAETVVVTDPRGSIVYANPAFETVTGYTCAEVLGRNPRILRSGQQDDAFYASMWATISSGRTWRGRLINRRKDGSLYTEDATISPVRDATGAITSYVAVKRDISRVLALEEQLRQSQKMDGIGRLAGGVAHDFNNILSVILGGTEYALESLREGDPLRDELLDIEQAAKRAASLTRQLLAFSRKQVLQPVVLRLNDVVTDLERMLRRILGEDVELVLDLSPDLGAVRADPGQMEQVLVNFAVNSRDAMPEGGRLTIETSNVDLPAAGVVPADATPGPHVRLIVRDTGVGMDDGTVARAFEPFFTTKGPGKGTGLGLATVYGIVRQSGGTVEVSSQPGAGATFAVYLPRVRAQGAVTRPPEVSTRRGGAETILLVEDDPAVRGLATRILGGAGYTVLTADGGREALYICQRPETPIDLVLTDVVMPGMSGRALIEEVTKLRRGVKTLYMSGYTDDAIVHHGVLEAGTNFIGKPLTRTELLKKVRLVLDA